MPEMVITPVSDAPGGAAPKISLKTHGAIMEKIDAWAESFEYWSLLIGWSFEEVT
jgi:hypothetical protein